MSFYIITLSIGSAVVGVASGYAICKWRFATSRVERRYYAKLMFFYMAFLAAFLSDLFLQLLWSDPNLLWRLIPLCFAMMGISFMLQAKALRTSFPKVMPNDRENR